MEERAPAPAGLMVRAVTSPVARTATLTIATALACACFTAGVVMDMAPLADGLHATWWQLAIAFAVTEKLVFHLEFYREEAHSFSLSEVALCIGLLFAAEPWHLVVGRLVGEGVVLVLNRQPPVKLSFNLVLFWCECCLALVLFQALRADDLASPLTWLAAAVGVAAADLLSISAVALVIRWHGAKPDLKPLAVAGMATALTNTCLALVGAILLQFNVATLVLLGILMAIAYVAYRGHASLSQRYSGLHILYDFTRVMSVPRSAESAMEEVLQQARQLMRANVGEVLLLRGAEAGDGAGLLRICAQGDQPLESTEIDAVDHLIEEVVSSGRSLRLTRGTKDQASRRLLDERGWKDCVITALHGGGTAIGALLVADRVTEVSTFQSDDVRLFETLAAHAGVALENGRLVNRLRAEVHEREHQALHDALTGLPNRVMFSREVDAALATPGVCGAVMLMDLDRFKDVNDTLGHHAGDQLLQKVASRLLRALGPGPVVARLSGDEFAVLLPKVVGPVEALGAAHTIRATLSEPLELDEVSLDVVGSIGIAMFPAHGSTTSELLKRADIAMYTAKGSHDGVQLYSAERDENTPRRLAIVADLRKAIEEGFLDVHFQPQVALADGKVVGIEALVRWNHPEHGMVPPDEFVPVAEQTGLIGPLTELVLQRSLAQCRRWWDLGFEVEVAVNISVRTLLDLDFPSTVVDLLRKAGLPSTALTLEITESGLMADLHRTGKVLERLAATGIKLAIDDFGTGYSSLSYLQRLPVQQVKIDKSFVLRMATDQGDAAIVRSIVELGRSLSKQVVAEGVEDLESYRQLQALGCAVGQGYYMSRPIPGDGLTAWLRERGGVFEPATPAPLAAVRSIA